MPSAQIDLYLQGATVSADTVVATTGTAPVYDAGALYAGALVQAGPGGPICFVASVDNARQVTLQNVNGTTLTIVAGTRLIVLSSRPIAYSNAFASGTPFGSTLTADSNGQAKAFLPEGSYDYIITDPADASVTLDTPTQATISGATSTLTINHTVGSAQTALLVAIAWQESTGEETIDSVFCGSAQMTRIGSSLFVELYGLLNPPSGAQTITVAWSGSNTKAAIGNALCISSAYPDALPGLTRNRSGSGTDASATNAGAMPRSLLLAAMGINIIPGATTETPLSGVTSLWSASAGSAGALDSTQANGASRPSAGAPTSIGWTLGASRPWGILTVEALPCWSSLVTDTRCATPFGVLATMYPDLQAAIDALPGQGGVVYIPAGTYRLQDGLVINQPNVTLIGEGATTVLTPADPVNNPMDIITIRASEVRISRLKIDGAATAMDLATGHSGIVYDGDDRDPNPARLVQHCFLENVIVTGNSRYGLWLRDTILLTAINCEVVSNKGTGMRIQGTDPHGSCDALRFLGCAFSSNGGLGVDIGDPVVPPDTIGTGQVSETFLGCTLESNEGNGHTLADVGISLNAQTGLKLEVLSCYFEAPAAGAKQFLRFQNCPNVTVDNCNFSGNPDDPSSGPDRAVSFVNCSWARAASNVAQGFKTEVILFDSGCISCVEMSNRDFDSSTGVPRITLGGAVVTGTSGLGLKLPTYADNPSRPDPAQVPTGTMIWVAGPTSPTTHLQISDGTSWISF